MTIKDILVHVDTLKPATARLRAAFKLAETFEARLTGLYVMVRPYVPPYADVQISPEVLEAQGRELQQLADDAGRAFEKATAGSTAAAQWRVVEGNAPDVLAVHSRYHDLTMLGQINPDDVIFPGDREMPDRVVLTAGGPVLVVPYVGTQNTIGENVMVAWDASAMAARAVRDAMPFLTRAKKVLVMVVNPRTDLPGIGDLPGADIAAHLARHGVNAEADHVQSDLDAGNMLLSRAADLGIDLIVMGAYGHARWAELVLGGVTDLMLDQMTVPVLMSH